MQNLVTLTFPAQDGGTFVPATEGRKFQLTFAPEGVLFERSGDDLVLSPREGDPIVLQGFFAPRDNGELPSFVLEDGAAVSGSGLLQQVNPSIDCDPAGGSSVADSLRELNLADYVDLVDFREVGSIDLGIGRESRLTVDDLLEGALNGLRINGDAGDQVVLKGDWRTDNVAVDGYIAYEHGDHTLYLQQEMEIKILTNS